jgi:hypothetical protein
MSRADDVPELGPELEPPPPGFYRVPHRCRCGAEFLALTVRPPVEGEPPRDRLCDLCAAGIEIRGRINAAAARTAAAHMHHPDQHHPDRR